MHDVIVTQLIKPGCEAEVESLLWELAKEVRANDKGCLRYEWYRSEVPCTYVLLGRWIDRSSAVSHQNAPHTTRALTKLADYADDRFKLTQLTSLD